MKEHEMIDHLRDAIIAAITDPHGPDAVHTKLADAIRAEIDKRMLRERFDAVARRIVAEPDADDSEVRATRQLDRENAAHMAALDAAKPQPAEPRRNPYADWADPMWTGNNNREFRKARFDAWNEGAQIAGERDE